MLSSAPILFAAQIHPPQSSDLVVHEWGTFTSVAGADGSAIQWDALGCKSDLPSFVSDFGYRGFKWRLQGTVRMETPVLYFYSARALEANVKVSFPQGLITEWYPRADYQAFQKSPNGAMRRLSANLNGIDTSLRTVTGAIEWQNIQIQPDASLVLPFESAPSRYYAARATDAAPLSVGGQNEKFLFYRGVGQIAVPLSARVSADGKITVENHLSKAVPTVILFENRQGRIGYRNAGALQDTVTLDPPSLDASFAPLRYDLEAALVQQGLYPKEAEAMLETWRDSWFEEGSRLIYLVPSETIDTVLPLEIEPAPSKITRVFVGRIELITPATRQTVEEALAKGDVATLQRYRRFLNPILESIPGGEARIPADFRNRCP